MILRPHSVSPPYSSISTSFHSHGAPSSSTSHNEMLHSLFLFKGIQLWFGLHAGLAQQIWLRTNRVMTWWGAARTFLGFVLLCWCHHPSRRQNLVPDLLPSFNVHRFNSKSRQFRLRRARVRDLRPFAGQTAGFLESEIECWTSFGTYCWYLRYAFGDTIAGVKLLSTGGGQ